MLLGRDGNLFSRERLANPLNSIRHLAVAADGTIACGQQYQGEPGDAVPLLAVKRPGQALGRIPGGRRAAPGYLAPAWRFTMSCAC